MLEFEDDTVGGGFQNTPDNCCYRGELNDPQLANAGQTQAVFEFMHTYDYWLGVEQDSPHYRLIKAIILCEPLPHELLNKSPEQLFLKMCEIENGDEIEIALTRIKYVQKKATNPVASLDDAKLGKANKRKKK